MGKVARVAACLSVFGLAGCVTIRLPLCPATAINSYPAGEEIPGPVNYFTVQEARRRGVSVKPLSWFAADFTGSYEAVKKLERDYEFVLCAFDPAKQLDDRQIYMSCMTRTDEWIAITQSPHPERLLTEQTMFKENCVVDGPIFISPGAGGSARPGT